MPRLILAFIEIALHRRGPEDLPASKFFFFMMLAAYLPVRWLVMKISPGEISHPVAALIVDAGFGLAFIWALLRAFEREARFRQTASALLGADILLNLLTIPPTFWLARIDAADGDPTIPVLILLFFSGWSIDIAGFVLSRALERPYVLAVLIMVGYVLLAFSLRATFFPPVMPATN